MNDQAKGLLITALGVLMVVPDSLFIRLIEAETLVITFWRCGLSALVIILFVMLQNKHDPLRPFRRIDTNGLIYAACSGFSSLMFVVSVQLTSVANTVFIIATMPVFAAVYSWLWMDERITKRMAWTIALVVIGICIIGYGSLGTSTSNLVGDFCAVMVAATFAFGLTAARKGRANSMVPSAAVGYLCLALILLPFINPFNIPTGDWKWVALHGGIFIAASTAFLSLGPRYITSAEVSLLILLESVLAPILVWFILGEEPNSGALIGGALVISVLFISNLFALMRWHKHA